MWIKLLGSLLLMLLIHRGRPFDEICNRSGDIKVAGVLMKNTEPLAFMVNTRKTDAS